MKHSRFKKALDRRDQSSKHIVKLLRRKRPFIMTQRAARSMDALTGGSASAALALMEALGYTWNFTDERKHEATPSK